VLTLALCGQTFGAHKYQETCTPTANTTQEISPGVVSTTTTKDSCDTDKFFVCRDFRCMCADPRNQIYTAREIKINDRRKRSPGKGNKGGKSKSKGVSTGTAVAGGVVAGVVGYEVGKAVAGSNNGGGGGGGSRGDSGSTSGHHKSKKVTVYGCYSRIQGDCVIDKDRVTYIENATTVVDASGNKTTTIMKHKVDYANMHPLCIPHAECKAKKTPPAGQDANVGECVCKDGYKKTTTDICVSGVQRLTSMAGFVMVLSVLMSQFLVRK